jgi:tryptophan halogenase
MGGIEVKPSPALRLADESAARKQFQEIYDKAQSLLEGLPTQHEYFTHLRG